MNFLLFIGWLFGWLLPPTEPATKPRREFRYQAINAGRAAFSQDGRLVVVSANKQRIGVFQARTALLVNEFKAHRKPVTELASWPDRDTIISGDTEGELLLWRPRTVQLVGRVQLPGRIQAIAPQPGSTNVAVLANGVAWLVDVATGKKTSLASWGPGRNPTALTFNATGTQLAIGYADGGLLIRNYLIKQSVAASPFKTPVRAIAYRRDSLLAVAGTPALFLSRATSPGSGKVVTVSKAVWSVAQPTQGDVVLGTLSGELLGYNPATQTETVLATATSTVRSLSMHPRERLLLANYQQAAPKSWLLAE